MVAAVRQVAQLERAACRRAFEERFSVQRMAQEYLAVYEQYLTTRQHIVPAGAVVDVSPSSRGVTPGK